MGEKWEEIEKTGKIMIAGGELSFGGGSFTAVHYTQASEEGKENDGISPSFQHPSARDMLAWLFLFIQVGTRLLLEFSYEREDRFIGKFN